MTKIIQRDAFDQYKEDYVTYAVYAIRTRVTPDIRDGLKQVHRRILYSGLVDAKAYGTHFTKSANWVGLCLANWHPHGDSSVYDAMKPMVNYWDINVPLITGQGSWGNIQGNAQAASRYTEASLSDFAYDNVLGEIKEVPDVVDWIDNYSGSKQEPEYLAVKVPLLLINGTFGIGIGMKSYVPPHNINEVIDATIKLIKNPNADIVLIPDQCLKCDIIETDFKSISKLGYGQFKVRGRMEPLQSITKELIPNKEYIGKPGILITSTPDLVNLIKIHEKLEKAVEENKLPQIIRILEPECDNKKKKDADKEMKFVIVLKKGSDPNYVMDAVYKLTDMESTFTVNMEVLDNCNPVRTGYRDYLRSFIEFRKCAKFRYYANMRQKVKTKLHEKDAYIKVLQSGEIDNIINMIRKRKDTDDVSIMEYLIKKLSITDLQARFIINANLKNLSLGYLNKYIADMEYLTKMDNFYFEKLANEELLNQEIIEELTEIKKKYGKPRNCRVISQAVVNNIPKGTFKIIITENNFIKKISVNENGIGSFKDDRPKFQLIGENEDSIVIFDSFGKVYKLPIYKIPVSDRNSNGIDVRLIIKQLTSNIVTVFYEPVLQKYFKQKVKHFIVVQTKGGNIKKMDIGDILGAPLSGIFYVKLGGGDMVSDVIMVGDGLDVICYSKNKALRMNISEIPEQRRSSKGNKAMDASEVDGLSMIGPKNTSIVVVTKNGYINKFDSVSFLPSARAKAGSRVIKLKQGDEIYTIYGANDNELIRITTKEGNIDISVNDIPLSSSASTGNKIIKGGPILSSHIMMKN